MVAPVASQPNLHFPTHEALQSRCRAILERAIYKPEEYLMEHVVHWSIFQGDQASMKHYSSTEGVREVLEGIHQETLDQFKADTPDREESPIHVEDEEVEEERLAYTNHPADNGITPLHVAVMVESLEAVEWLITEAKCDVDVRDGAGATPLHHAALLGNRPLCERLVQAGVPEGALDFSGARYSEIFACCHPDLEAITSESPAFYEETGAYLLKEKLLVSPLVWLEEWEKNTEERALEYVDTQKELRARYREFKEAPPLKFARVHDPRMGFYLRAEQVIPPFTIIGEYFGVIDPDHWKEKKAAYLQKEEAEIQGTTNRAKLFAYLSNPETEYNIEGIDGYAFRGEMGLLPSAFPNLMARAVLNMGVARERVVLISMEEIPAGSVLAFDYGEEHAIKKGPYVELRCDEMRAFFSGKELALLKDFLCYRANDKLLEEHLEQIANQAKVKYVLNTPSAMVDLVLRGILTCEMIQELFDCEKGGDGDSQVLASMFCQETAQKLLFETLQEYCKALEGIDVEEVEGYKQALLSMLGTATAWELILEMERVVKVIEEV